MNEYCITYVQELTQPIEAVSIAEAAAYAKRYADTHRMRVNSVERVLPVGDLPPKRAA